MALITVVFENSFKIPSSTQVLFELLGVLRALSLQVLIRVSKIA